MADYTKLLERLEERLRPLIVDLERSWWESNTASSAETEQRRQRHELALRAALADAESFALVRDAVADADDPRQRRQLQRLVTMMQPNQLAEDMRVRLVELETRVEAIYNTHRGEIDGERVDDNRIAEILTGSDDSDLRRKAWEASKSVGAAVAALVRDLVVLRNEAAQSLGYRDHYAMALGLNELDEDRLFATLDEVEAATTAPFTAWKAKLDDERATRFGVSVADLRSWHYDDPFFQDAPAGDADVDAPFTGLDLEALTLRTYDGLGIDLRPVLERSDLVAREGKSQHAFCIDLDRAGDVRVLCNNVANQRWMTTMLHEFGHAAYSRSIGDDLPFFLHESAHLLTDEAVAMLFGRLTRDSAWLTSIAGVDGAEVERLGPALAEARRGNGLVFARWALVMIHFERGLYRDPGGDHDTRWWDLVERFQLVPRPDGRDAPDWAAKIHLAVAPVYYQNYLYGELLASQMEAALRREVGAVIERREVGAWLVERMFRPGASLRWDHLVEAATGEPLQARHFVEQYVGAGADA